MCKFAAAFGPQGWAAPSGGHAATGCEHAECPKLNVETPKNQWRNQAVKHPGQERNSGLGPHLAKKSSGATDAKSKLEKEIVTSRSQASPKQAPRCWQSQYVTVGMQSDRQGEKEIVEDMAGAKEVIQREAAIKQLHPNINSKRQRFWSLRF